MDDRGVTPVVGKTLEIAIVLAYVSMVAGILYGGVVPTTQASAEATHAESTLIRAADAIDNAVPPTGVSPTVIDRVSLPESIAGEPYRIYWTNGSLVLTHPHQGIGGRVPVPVPTQVVTVQGNWTGSGVVVVNTTERGWVVTLEEGGS